MTVTTWACAVCGHTAENADDAYCSECGAGRGSEPGRVTPAALPALPSLNNYSTLHSYGSLLSGIGWMVTAVGGIVLLLGVVSASQGGVDAAGGMVAIVGGVVGVLVGFSYVIFGQGIQCFVGIERHLALMTRLLARPLPYSE